MIKNKKIKDEDIKMKDEVLYICSDLHFPFQDKNAVNTFMLDVEEHSPDVIILNGDLMDFYKLSRFSKDPNGRNPEDEIKMCKDFLDWLREIAPHARIYYTIGNHESRLAKYVLDNAPYICNLVEDVFDLLEVKDYDVVGCHSVTINDKFIVKHGSRLGSKSGLSAIKELEAHYLSGATGHTHRLAKFTTRKSGRRFVWFETGCLCTLNPEYMIQPDWQQGYVVATFDNKGRLSESHIVEIGE